MKKLFTVLLLSFVLGFVSIAEAGNISANTVSTMYNQCNPQESLDVFYYLESNSISRNPYDVFGNTLDSLISTNSFVDIWRNNGVLTNCSDWSRVSNVAVANDPNGALALQNYDGCVFNRPNTPKYNDPNRIDAQIHFNILYHKVFNGAPNSIKSKFYHRDQGQNNWTCYPAGNTVSSYNSCPDVTAKYGVSNIHNGECINYRLFWCGDGLLNRPGGHTTYTNGNFSEQCDPNDPNKVGWGNAGCSNTCKALNQDPAPTCTLTVTTGQNSTYNISWNVLGTFNPTQITITPPLVNTPSYNVNTNNGTYNVVPNGYGNFNISMTVANSAGSNVCTGSFYIPEPEKKVCGDGKIDRPNDAGVYEECDNGPNFGNGCNNQCKLMAPSCTLTVDSQYQLIGNPVTFTANKDSWARFLSFNLGDTIFGSPNIIHTNNITFPYQHSFTNMLTYNQTLTVQNNHPVIATGVTRPTATCNNNIQVVPGCNITVEPHFINIGDTAEISWQIWPDFNIPTFMNISPVLVGSWPYNIYYKTGKTYVGPNIVNEGIYTISMNAWTTNGYPFSCTGELNVGREVQNGILDIEKTLLTTGVLSPGDFVDYRISLTNIGSGIFYDAYITDVLPRSLDLVYRNLIGVYPYQSEQWQDIYGDWFFEYSGFDLMPGQTVHVELRGKIRHNPSAHETTNCAYTSGDLSCVRFGLSPEPYIQKYQSTVFNYDVVPFTTGSVDVDHGHYLVYRIDFANTGSSATTGGVRIVDYMPLCIGYASGKIYGVADAQLQYFQDVVNGRWVVEYNGFDLEAGQTGYIILTGKIMDNPTCNTYTTFTNTSYIHFANPNMVRDSSVIANRATKSVVVLTKDSTPDTHPIGDYKLFEIQLQNHGPNQISNVTLEDVWPNTSCIHYVDWTGSAGLAKDPLGLTWTYPSLNPGEIVNLYISGAIANNASCAAPDYINTINLRYTEMGREYTGQAEYHFAVIPNSSVSLIKVPDRNVVRSGDLITYTITYGNNGGLDFVSYNLVDVLPPMVQYISASPTPNTNITMSTGSILTWNYGALPIGQTGQIILTGRIIHGNNSTITNNVDINYNTIYGTGGTHASVTIVYQETPIDPYVGVCGDGRIDDREECDLWDSIANILNPVRIGTYLDLTQNHLAGTYGNGGYYCQECRIRAYDTNEFVYQPPQCLGTNTTISVMENELIPFWWRLWEQNDQFVRSNYNCAGISDYESRTIINQDSMRCTFSVYDGNRHQQNDDNPLNTFAVDCYEKDNSIIFDYFEKEYKINFNKVAGKYVYNTRHMFNGNVDTYGEYKLVLERVDYEYCNPISKTWQAGRTYRGICEVNFAFTRPYIMQISTFGINPTATSASDFLRDFYDMRGNPLINSTDIQNTMNVDSTSYEFDSPVSEQMTAFKQKYEALSIEVDKNFKVRGNVRIRDIFNEGTVKKVPNQMIFFVKGNGQLILKQLTEYFPGTPFTIYIEGMDVLVEGSVKTNGMIITDRKISFEDDSSKGYCEEGGQVVHGIFVARGGFDSVSRTRNTDKNEKRCPWGNLHVKGVLIGGGVQKLIENRRAHLNDWFNVKSNLESAIKKERRNEIFEGAALLIEYNPSLWTQLPPGADSFTKTLEVYKK